MHSSSLENMKCCYATYFATSNIAKQSKIKVLDIGGADVNGSYSDLFRDSCFDYKGVDLESSEGVSIVLDDPYKLPVDDESIDLVITGQMLEHCEFFWLTFQEMMRVLKKSGMLFLIAPSQGPIHRYPVDCYRFYPDAFHALAKYANCHAIDVWRDNRGPWNDLVGVFSKTKYAKRTKSSYVDAQALAKKTLYNGPLQPEIDIAAGTESYIETLDFLHKALKPEHYLEIGVRKGKSLSLANCPAVGVDPNPEIDIELLENTTVIAQSSDDYFKDASDTPGNHIDFAFIDGMHLFEYALRDFMNIERMSRPGTIVVIDDIFPNHHIQANRERESAFWTGDVWKLFHILKENRPELALVPVNTHPTGLLIIFGLDPENEVLWEKYNPIVAQFMQRSVPPSILQRAGAVEPKSDIFKTIMQVVKVCRTNKENCSNALSKIKTLINKNKSNYHNTRRSNLLQNN